jgi:tRNA1(Val) A37 N6-methylase TrmN6
MILYVILSGCGTGFALLSAMTKPLHKILGVDLHEGSTKMAWRNVKKFNKNKELVQCSDVSVFHQDMVEFKNYPAPNEEQDTIILYMYEPLW